MKLFFIPFFLSFPILLNSQSDNSSANTEIENNKTETKSTPTNGLNQFHIDFVGTANLQQSINQANENVQGSAGLGVIFERYFLSKKDGKLKHRFIESLDMEAYINVASSIDSLSAELNSNDVTNTRLFGSYILNPISPKQSIYINTNIYFDPGFELKKMKWFNKLISGANVRVNASNVLWNLDDGTNNISTYASALSFKFGFFHEFIPNNMIRNEKNQRKYSVRLGLNYGSRHIFGDISSESNNALRNQYLGSNDKNFSGLEPFFSFRLNNMIAEFTMPYLIGSSKVDIEGLTDTQFQFSIRFVGGFSLKINDDNNED